jgi:pyruvate formate lyase activating enzyme
MDSLASQASPQSLANACVESGCRSIAYTYNDPVIFLEYAVDVAQACAERGIKSIAVSGGYINPEPRREFFKHMNAANIDLKGFSQDFYQKLCGGKLQTVLETLDHLVNETDVWVEITTLLIPGENDQPDKLRAMCQWIVNTLGVDVPLHFTAFHPDFKMLDKPRTPLKTLLMARNIAQTEGIRHVYTGNVGHVETGSSCCHNCQKFICLSCLLMPTRH